MINAARLFGHTVALIGTAGALVAPVAAQAQAPGVGDAGGLIEVLAKTLGPLAILGFYLYYDITVAQPRKDKAAQDERAAMTDAAEKRVNALVDSHKQLSEAFAAAMKSQTDAFSQTAAGMTSVHEKMIENCLAHRGEKLPVGA